MKIIDGIMTFALTILISFCIYAAFDFETAVIILLAAILFRLLAMSDALREDAPD